MLAGDLLRGRIEDGVETGVDVVPHFRLGEHHQRPARGPLVFALRRHRAPQADTGVVFRFHHL